VPLYGAVLISLLLAGAFAETPTPSDPPEVKPTPNVPGPPVRQPDGTCLCECECLFDPRFVPSEADDEDAGTYVAPGKNFRWTPYASPGASPELGALIAAGALFSFSLDPDDPELPRSSITTAVTFSTTGALLITVLPTFYLPNDKIRILANIYFKDMADNYWGVGFQEGATTELGPDTTAYDKLWWQLNPRVVFQVAPDVFVGGLLDLNQTSATNMNDKMASDPYVLEEGANNFNTGIGPIFQYDSRDFPQNAFKGMFFEVRGTVYGSWVGQAEPSSRRSSISGTTPRSVIAPAARWHGTCGPTSSSDTLPGASFRWSAARSICAATTGVGSAISRRPTSSRSTATISRRHARAASTAAAAWSCGPGSGSSATTSSRRRSCRTWASATGSRCSRA